MWICLSDAFFSIVTAPGQPEHLLIRARRPGDLQRVFPGHAVKRTPGRDYLFRAVIPRLDVANALSEAVFGLAYGNFKNSVRDNRLHGAYHRIWDVMADLQPLPPYASERRARRQDRFVAHERETNLGATFDWAVPGLTD